jgi:putative inorganic carbon (hco3(-)) transporter
MILIAKLSVAVLFLLQVIISLSYSFLPNLPDYDTKRVVELLLICAVLISAILKPSVLAQSANATASKLSDAIQLIPNAIIILACFSALFSNSPRHAFLEVSLFAGLACVSLFFARLWKDYRHLLLKGTVYAIILGAIIYMVGFFTGYLASFIERILLRWPEPFFGFSSVRAFNQYQLWTLPLFLLPLQSFEIDKTSFRRGLFTVLIAWWVLFFYSSSRGVILAILFASVVTILFYKRTAWPMLRLLLISLIVGVSTYIVLFFLIPFVFIDDSLELGSVLRDSTDDRLSLWRQALAMIQAHPILGVGPMHYAWYPNVNAHPHNSVLQLACEWGLPATFLILFLSGYGVVCWLKRFNSTTLSKIQEIHWHLPIILFFTLIANAFYSLVDGVIVMPLSQVMMAVVIGLMIGVYRDDVEQHKYIETSTAKFLLYRLGAIAVLAVLIWAVLPDLLPRILGDTEMIQYGYQTAGPRFWQEGGIPH